MDADQIKTERWELLWAVQRSQRYHSRRSAFYSRWNKATALTGVLGGSAVFASLGQAFPAIVGTLAAGAVIVLSGADLVAGTSEMSRKHNDLRKRFCDIETDIVSVEPTPEKIAHWKATRLAIESDEPPTYVALDILCENELARSYSHLRNAPVHSLPWYKRITAHLLIWADS
ncbi:hypothetical protein GGR60_000903 [Xanthomonas arboricola]|uniref:hypothetical protein n=1 Tax=Xanthomonas euroxanthea TaxID=2259622 RepID=UPI001430229A|nr:hypothetical protein [Xanthomonas euroxanthea]NJC36413.1 hypothetical protein [Xanthomonas euroxanthea]